MFSSADKKNITVNCIMLAQGEEGDGFGKQLASGRRRLGGDARKVCRSQLGREDHQNHILLRWIPYMMSM